MSLKDKVTYSSTDRLRASLISIFQNNGGLFASIFRRYRLQQVDEADLHQEVITRALEALAKSPIEEPKGFLIGIAKNIARRELERRIKATQTLVDAFDTDQLHSPTPSADEQLVNHRLLAQFGGVIVELPAQCQKVFILKHVYGASHKEIAHKLNITVSTVEKHVALGLKRCRESMMKKDVVKKKAAIPITSKSLERKIAKKINERYREPLDE